MTETMPLRSDTVSRLGRFLDDFGPGWAAPCSLEQAQNALFGLLHDQTHDERCWRELQELVESIRVDLGRTQYPGVYSHDTDVLSNQKVQRLLDEVRQRSAAATPCVAKPDVIAFLSHASVPVATCLTTLAAAFLGGCGRTAPAPTDPVQPSPQTAAAANTIGASTGLETDACANNADALDALFRDGSPDQIAATLEAIVDAGVEASIGARHDATSGASKRVKTPLPSPMPAPTYKGITI